MVETSIAPLLSRSACGQDVVHLQAALAAAGAFEGDVDGSFGPATAKALADFESKHGLPSTGNLMPRTAELLGWRKMDAPPSRLPGVTEALVGRLFSKGAFPHIQANLPNVLNALADNGLAERAMVAMALATVRVETGSFLPISELPSSFNTSRGGKSFDLYDQRAGLGNLGTPDGSRFRGRGFIQLTGRANYAQLGATLNLGMVKNPFLAHESAVSARILAAFLKTRETRIRAALAANRLPEARKLVNGGSNGLNEFVTTYELAMQLLPQDSLLAA